MLLAPYILFATLMAFLPIWCGGQAMKCYQEGHVFRSAACVCLATFGNLGLFWLVWLFADQHVTFLTLFSQLVFFFGV
jgi:hypothetical protein